MNKQELIEYLIHDIENYGFEVTAEPKFPKTAMTNTNRKMVIYNSTNITAFELAHERSHIINQDSHRDREYDVLNPNEVRSNKEAILLLWDIFEKQGGTFEYFSLFVDLTESPYNLAYNVISKEYADMYEAINEIFEEEIQIKLNKEEMRRRAIEYISGFDIIETINIYNFLDSYHLGYNLYDMAEKEFNAILEIA